MAGERWCRMSFAEMLRALRTEAGWTQEELADKSGAPLWTIRSYERGQREAGWRALLDLCKAFSVDPRVFDACVPGEPTPTRRGRPRKDAEDAPAQKRKRKG
jgi:transcriptional regulator with XRE-family HTH domain